jgi:hypothetical protein
MRKFILALSLIATVATFTACSNSSASGKFVGSNTIQPNDEVMRAKVLENSTITYVVLPKAVSNIYHPGDTVWLSLKDHRIHDTDTTTLRAVLSPEALDVFYDGEGNPIPLTAVQLYVKDHFVHLDKEDSVYMRQYFY